MWGVMERMGKEGLAWCPGTLGQADSYYFQNVAVVQSQSCLTLVTPWPAAHHTSLSFTISQSLLRVMSIETMMPSNPFILCRPLLLMPSIFPSIRVFSSESALHIQWPQYYSFNFSISSSRSPSIQGWFPLGLTSLISCCPRDSQESALHIRWPKYWSFSFNISSSNEYPGLISFRMGWLDLLAVQGTLKSLLQHHSSKASIRWHSAFFIVQLSHPYMTTGKTIALTRWTFVDKVMSLLFNMLSRLVITFLPRSKRLLITINLIAFSICSDFGAQKNKVSHCFRCFPIY